MRQHLSSSVISCLRALAGHSSGVVNRTKTWVAKLADVTEEQVMMMMIVMMMMTLIIMLWL